MARARDMCSFLRHDLRNICWVTGDLGTRKETPRASRAWEIRTASVTADAGGEWDGRDLFVGNAQAEEQALATSSESSDGGILCAGCGVPLASRTELVHSIFTVLQSRNTV